MNEKRILINPNFGDLFLTRDGCKAVFIESHGEDGADDEPPARHTMFVEGSGIRHYYGYGCCTDGTYSDDIVERLKDPEADVHLRGCDAAHIANCLESCKRVIAASERRDKRAIERIKKLIENINGCKRLLDE